MKSATGGGVNPKLHLMAARPKLEVVSQFHHSASTMTSNDCPVIVLTSGQTVQIKGIELYNAQSVVEIANLRAEATQKMGGVSTGLGFIGSPGWAIGGAAALGLLEGLLSSSAKKQGVEMLQTAFMKSTSLRQTAKFFLPTEIENIQSPYPANWTAQHRYMIDLNDKEKWDRDAILRKHNKTKDHLVNGILHLTERYVHQGEEFVTIETEIGQLDVRWTQVAAYRPSQLDKNKIAGS
jgi:hypothetical protein